jgi:hypothetical protein
MVNACARLVPLRWRTIDLLSSASARTGEGEVPFVSCRICAAVGCLVALGVISPGPASAYIDPGAGSFALQVIIAFLVGALFALKVYWNKLKEFIKRLRGRESHSDS